MNEKIGAHSQSVSTDKIAKRRQSSISDQQLHNCHYRCSSSEGEGPHVDLYSALS